MSARPRDKEDKKRLRFEGEVLNPRVSPKRLMDHLISHGGSPVAVLAIYRFLNYYISNKAIENLQEHLSLPNKLELYGLKINFLGSYKIHTVF